MSYSIRNTAVLFVFLAVSHNAFAASTSAQKYSVSIGAMAFSDFSPNTDADFVGASYSMPWSLSVKRNDLRVGVSGSFLTQIQSDDSTLSGSGDISVSLSYAVNDWMNVKVKHKFSTGDEDLGFSSGEDDNALSLDFYHIASYQAAYFATTGYKWVGKGDRTDRVDGANLSLGASYIVSPSFNLAGSLDYSQSTYTTSGDVTALTLFGSHKTTRTAYVGWFVSRDTTSTYSIGTSFGRSF
jgi:hypothetical protein